MSASKILECRDCGITTARNSPGQRYCHACSERRDLMRKRLWAREHPPDEQQAERNRVSATHRKQRAKEAGADASVKAKRSIAWYDPDGPDLAWITRVAVPFSYAASKNHIYALRRSGHVTLRAESRAIRNEIAFLIRQTLGGKRIAHNKVWIDILVQKPNHKGDAVNVIDLVCDALKEALGVDDRWFCIRRLDWEIVKESPKLFIGIGQESPDDCRVCSYCGQIKSLGEFNKKKDDPLGVGRECKQCRRDGRALSKALSVRCTEVE